MNALAQYINLYKEHAQQVNAHAPEALNRLRPWALEALESARLPRKGDEKYPALSVEEMFAPDYGVNINRVPFSVDTAETFRCGVPNVSVLLAVVANDVFRPTTTLQRNLPEGVTVMSLAQAAKEMPELVEKYYGKLVAEAPEGPSTASLLNTLLAQDGIFVHVAKNVHVDKPIQIVNISNASAPMMSVRRILVVLEDGAKASMLLCDHTANQEMQYLNSQVAELYLGNGAQLDYYDMEETSPSTSRHSDLYACQSEGSRLVANGITLVGGTTRNNYTVDLTGPHTSTVLGGMAVCADKQVVDNCTNVRHNCEKGESQQMFKYILDNESVGSFYGTIRVDEKAKYTNAYQSNKNILASTDARMHTRPQLEIYCDEVKCSHGATVGQLDQNALFYMRARGIPEAEARMMLMQAFMADVIDSVSIPSLQSRLHQLVEMRLSGKRQLCGDCDAHCDSDKQS